MSQRYMAPLAEGGGVPLMIPLVGDADTLRAISDRLDGLFLPGGVDIDPGTYGQARHPLCGRTDLDRDRTEITLARWAAEEGKPVLGVCRGVQILNVAGGGTLYQDIEAHRPGSIKHDYFPTVGFARDHLAHDVTVHEGSRLASIFGAHNVRVNSMHHQGIRDLAPGLVPTAVAPDGLVEALEGSNGQFLVGVQWHPEALIARDSHTVRLFGAFIDAAREYGSRRALSRSPS